MQKPRKSSTDNIGYAWIIPIVITLILLFLFLVPAHAQEPVIARGILLYSPTCPHCHKVINEDLPPLYQTYGDQLDLLYVDVTDQANYGVLRAAAQTYPDLPNVVPLLIIDGSILTGSQEIPARLPGLIDGCLAKGGCDWPIDLQPEGGGGDSLSSEAQPVYMAYFYDPTCLDCDRVSLELEALQAQYPNLVVQAYDITQNPALSEAFADAFAVPGDQRLLAPAIFVGEEALIAESISLVELDEVVSRLSQTGTTPPWEDINVEETDFQNSIVARFETFSLLAVAGAGLLDGVNPCAFTTIIFFVSYLSLVGRKGREIILVGVSFTLAVFLTYTALGLGLSEFVRRIGQAATFVGRVIYILTALVCIVLAAISISDYVKIRKGKLNDITLQLPRPLKHRVHDTIRSRSRVTGFVGAAFATGILVSVFELACTGQVYLPTILFVTQIAELRAAALGYLVLYNLMFVMPLMGVFLVTYLGTSNKSLTAFFKRHSGAVKALTAVFFLVLGIWLLVLVI